MKPAKLCLWQGQSVPTGRALLLHNGHDPVASITISTFSIGFSIFPKPFPHGWHAVRCLTKGEHWHYETQPKRNKETAHQIVPPQGRTAYQDSHFVAPKSARQGLELPESANPPRKYRQRAGFG